MKLPVVCSNLSCHAWLGAFAKQILHHPQVAILRTNEQRRRPVNHLTMDVGAVWHKFFNHFEMVTLARNKQRSSSVLVHTPTPSVVTNKNIHCTALQTWQSDIDCKMCLSHTYKCQNQCFSSTTMKAMTKMTKTFWIIIDETKTKTKNHDNTQERNRNHWYFSPDDIDENIWSKVWHIMLSSVSGKITRATWVDSWCFFCMIGA